MKRTKEQRQANELDRQLHMCRLAMEAMPFISPLLRMDLQVIRSKVRVHMHAKDREETAGA